MHTNHGLYIIICLNAPISGTNGPISIKVISIDPLRLVAFFSTYRLLSDLHVDLCIVFEYRVNIDYRTTIKKKNISTSRFAEHSCRIFFILFFFLLLLTFKDSSKSYQES